MGMKNSQILWPVRTALSGKAATPGGATELAELLGRKKRSQGSAKVSKTGLMHVLSIIPPNLSGPGLPGRFFV